MGGEGCGRSGRHGLLIYHWTSLAKNLNGAKRFDDYTVVIVSGNTKQRRCSFKYTMGSGRHDLIRRFEGIACRTFIFEDMLTPTCFGLGYSDGGGEGGVIIS